MTGMVEIGKGGEVLSKSFVSPALGLLVGEEGHYGELGSSPLVQTVTMEHSIPPTGSGLYWLVSSTDLLQCATKLTSVY